MNQIEIASYLTLSGIAFLILLIGLIAFAKIKKFMIIRAKLHKRKKYKKRQKQRRKRKKNKFKKLKLNLKLKLKKFIKQMKGGEKKMFGQRGRPRKVATVLPSDDLEESEEPEEQEETKQQQPQQQMRPSTHRMMPIQQEMQQQPQMQSAQIIPRQQLQSQPQMQQPQNQARIIEAEFLDSGLYRYVIMSNFSLGEVGEILEW